MGIFILIFFKRIFLVNIIYFNVWDQLETTNDIITQPATTDRYHVFAFICEKPVNATVTPEMMKRAPNIRLPMGIPITRREKLRKICSHLKFSHWKLYALNIIGGRKTLSLTHRSSSVHSPSVRRRANLHIPTFCLNANSVLHK